MNAIGNGEFTSARLLVGADTVTAVRWPGVNDPNGSWYTRMVSAAPNPAGTGRTCPVSGLVYVVWPTPNTTGVPTGTSCRPPALIVGAENPSFGWPGSFVAPSIPSPSRPLVSTATSRNGAYPVSVPTAPVAVLTKSNV